MDREDLCYEYDTFIVLRHIPSGRLFYANDSGCSCPTPFEDFFFKGPDDTNMIEIRAGHAMDHFKAALEEWGKRAHIPIEKLDSTILTVRSYLNG